MADSIFGFPAPEVLPLVFGMVHVQALPGTPFAHLGMEKILHTAVEEALTYQKAGFHGIILENMHDRPYLKGGVGPEITAGMTAVAVKVREAVGPEYPIGIQILAGANTEALAVAHSAGLNFIRAEGFVFAHTADEGWIEACAGELLRFRRKICAEHVKIWADIQKKHSSHAITADLNLSDWAHGAEFFGVDGVIITGTATGLAAEESHLREVKQATRLPVAIGSGISPENIAHYSHADALIVGSSLKKGGSWENPLDPKALRHLMAAWKNCSHTPATRG